MMRNYTALLAAGLLACSMTAFAADERGSDSIAADERGSDSIAATDSNASVVRSGTTNTQFGDECAWGLANGKHVKTNCAINMTGSDGKTYCFSSDQAMAAYMRDPVTNLDRANKNHGRS